MLALGRAVRAAPVGVEDGPQLRDDRLGPVRVLQVRELREQVPRFLGWFHATVGKVELDLEELDLEKHGEIPGEWVNTRGGTYYPHWDSQNF